jgi:hypothetical protein
VYYRRTARGHGLLDLFADDFEAGDEPVGLVGAGAQPV